MIKPLQQNTILVPAGALGVPGIAKGYMAGSFFYVKASTAVFRVQFDSQEVFAFEGGFKVENTGEFATQTFYNDNAFPITINYYVGEIGVDYVGSNEQKEASTFTVGNLNGAGNITPNSSGWIEVPSATLSSGGKCTNLSSILKVPGIYQGHVRKTIMLTLDHGENTECYVFNTNGYAIALLNNDYPPRDIVTSDTLYIGGKAGGADLVVGEIYYSI